MLSKDHHQPDEWAFNFDISSDNVYDRFLILSLLEDHEQHHDTLTVPHDGLQKDRFKLAMQEQNQQMRLYQPELQHHCEGCCRIYFGDDSKHK
jgi:hypothetical protein